MDSQAYANPLSRRLASLSIAADQKDSVPHDHTKVPPSMRADKVRPIQKSPLHVYQF